MNIRYQEILLSSVVMALVVIVTLDHFGQNNDLAQLVSGILVGPTIVANAVYISTV